MRQRLLAGISLLAIFGWHPAARATPIDFTFTGNIVGFIVPNTDTYQILAFGAGGGDSEEAGPGGGAEIGGDFSLSAGEVLQIAVGGRGVGDLFGPNGGGGGAVS